MAKYRGHREREEGTKKKKDKIRVNRPQDTTRNRVLAGLNVDELLLVDLDEVLQLNTAEGESAESALLLELSELGVSHLLLHDEKKKELSAHAQMGIGMKRHVEATRWRLF